MSFRSMSGSSLSPYNRSIVDNDPELCAPLQLLAIAGQETAALDNNVDKLLLIVRVWIAGKVLELGMETKFTALVLLHRYWNAIDSASTSQHQPDGENWKWVAASCLFLACKAEEEPRRLRDVINVAYMLQFGIDGNRGNNQLPVNQKLPPQQHASKAKKSASPAINSNGDNGTNGCNSTANGAKASSDDKYILLEIVTDPPPLDDTYWRAKEQLVATEQRVLRWLHFDVIVSHPHRMVLILVKELITTMNDNEQDQQRHLEATGNDPLLLCDNLISLAWQRLNDSLFYGPALTHSAMHMACVAISLAATALVEVAPTTTTIEGTELEQSPTGHKETDQPTSFAMESTSAAKVLTDNLQNVQQDQPHPAEIALLNMLAGNPTWWRRYDVSDQEFHDTKRDMCRGTEILGQMKVTVN